MLILCTIWHVFTISSMNKFISNAYLQIIDNNIQHVILAKRLLRACLYYVYPKTKINTKYDYQ